jgi:hypothetical protein
MHTKIPHKNLKLVNGLSVGFLVMSLAAVTITVSDPVRRQLLSIFAETNVTPPTTTYGTTRPSATPLRSPTPTPRGSIAPIPTPANNGTVTLVSPCYRACTIEDIMLPGQTPGRIGYIYTNGNVAGFYQAPNGLYYPVAESGGGPTQNDIDGLAQTINAQRTASFNPDSYLALTQINPTVAQATTQQLTNQCQADRPPSTINCTTQQGIYQYLTYQHTQAQRIMNELNSTRPGVDSTLQIMINLAQLQVYMSRNIISRDTYLQMAQHAANLVNLANAQRVTPTPSPRPTPTSGSTIGSRNPTLNPSTSPRSTASPFSGVTGSVGARTPVPSGITGIRATLQPGTLATIRPTLPGLTGAVGSRTVSPRPTLTGTAATVRPGILGTPRPTLPGLTGVSGGRTVSPRPTSAGVVSTLQPGLLGSRTPSPGPLSHIRTGSGGTEPTPFNFVDYVNNAIREAGRTIGLGPSPTPATRQATTPDTRVGISQNGQTTTTYVNTDNGLITTTTQIVKDPTTGRVTDTNITQTRITQTTYEETAAGLVRNDTVITTDLTTGRVIDTQTNSTLLTSTSESRLPGLNPDRIRGTAGPSATNPPSLGQQFVDLVNRLIGNNNPPVQRTPSPTPNSGSGGGNSIMENILRFIGVGPTPGTTGTRTVTSGLGQILQTPAPTPIPTPRVTPNILQNTTGAINTQPTPTPPPPPATTYFQWEESWNFYDANGDGIIEQVPLVGGCGADAEQYMSEIGCGPTTVANIINQSSNNRVTPNDIASTQLNAGKIDCGGTDWRDNMEVLQDYNYNYDIYSGSLQNIPNFTEPDDIIWISANVDAGGPEEIPHHTYFNGYSMEILPGTQNPQPVFNLVDPNWGDEMKCTVASDTAFRCQSPGGNAITIRGAPGAGEAVGPTLLIVTPPVE